MVEVVLRTYGVDSGGRLGVTAEPHLSDSMQVNFLGTSGTLHLGRPHGVYSSCKQAWKQALSL